MSARGQMQSKTKGNSGIQFVYFRFRSCVLENVDNSCSIVKQPNNARLNKGASNAAVEYQEDVGNRVLVRCFSVEESCSGVEQPQERQMPMRSIGSCSVVVNREEVLGSSVCSCVVDRSNNRN